MNQQSLTNDILEHLAELGKIAVNAFFPKWYPGTGPIRKLAGLSRPCRHDFSPRQIHTISSILSRLRQEGLVARAGPRKKSTWSLTRKGKTHLDKPELGYHHIPYDLPPSDKKVRLVTFDIPERERKKRNWLRIQLAMCEFKPLQKSVWIGTRSLPENFIQKLDELRLSDYIHIVSIGEKGTLTRIV